MSSPLKQLVEIISDSVQALESAYDQNDVAFPSINDPFVATPMDTNMELKATAQLIVAAAFHLIATVRHPMESLQEHAPAMYTSSALAVVVDANVADIIKPAGPQGMHAKDIAVKAGIDSRYLARIVRYLAARHVFREVTPDVFANNRISSLLVKGKPLEEIQADPEGQFDKGPAAGFVSHACDEGMMGAAKMSEFLRERKGACSPFNMALGRATKIWDLYDEPGNTWRGRRFRAAMAGGTSGFPSSLFTDALDWKSLSPGSVVVDVGGGVGLVSSALAKAFPHLRYVVQDLEKVIFEGRQFWENTYPDATKTGMVSLQVHDFFKPQPIRDAAVYFTRVVIHDWADGEARMILKNIRAAAGPSSKLVLFEILIPYACEDPENTFVNSMRAPPPLIPTAGPGGLDFLTFTDMQMLSLLDAQERTFRDFTDLGHATGWKLEGVQPGPLAAIVFGPA